MVRYRVEFQPNAGKALLELDKPVRRRVLRAVTSLEEDPRPAGVRALRNRPGLLRFGVGSYRVVYTVVDDQVLVLVVAVGHHSVVYRDLV